MADNFEPRIVAFLCNWCSYAGADMAGISRIQYLPNIRVIRVMCSGRVDPIFVFQSFLCGFDAVLVLGCHPGDCHYLVGNYHTEKKMNRVRKLLEIVGVEPERLLLDWVSAAEGARFAQIVSSFTEKVKNLGPFRKDGLEQGLEAGKATVQSERIRWLLGKEFDLLQEGTVFGEKLSPSEIDLLLDTALRDEYLKNLLTLILKEKPLSCKEIASLAGLSPMAISSCLIDLEESGAVSLRGFEGKTPKYIAG